MFRIKKTSAGDSQEPAVTERPVAAEEDSSPKAPARRTAPLPARPLGSPNFPIDLARRDIGGGGTVRSEPAPAVGRDKCLVVGKDVRLQGEVLACDKIIIEGEVDMKLSGCRSLQIGPSGVFRGTADVGEADVAGRFEGELSSRERLAVRATGRLEGKFRYGQITIDAGGRIVGDFGVVDAPMEPAAPARAELPVQPVEPAAVIERP